MSWHASSGTNNVNEMLKEAAGTLKIHNRFSVLVPTFRGAISGEQKIDALHPLATLRWRSSYFAPYLLSQTSRNQPSFLAFISLLPSNGPFMRRRICEVVFNPRRNKKHFLDLQGLR